MELNQQSGDSGSSSADSDALIQSPTNVNYTVPLTGYHVLLSTTIVHVQDLKGKMHLCRAFLDNASQSSFITIELVKKLGLKQLSSCVSINSVGGSKAETHSSVKVKLQSRLNGFKAELNCLVLQKIAQDIPTVSINQADISVPAGITLADPEFLKLSKIDMLIGVEIFWDIICIG